MSVYHVSRAPLPTLPQDEAWFTRTEVRPGIWCLTEPHVVDFMRSNLWFLEGRDRDLLIDTGNGIAPLSPALPRTGRPLVVVATHAHADHVGGLSAFPGALCHHSIIEALRKADPDATLAGKGYAIDNLSGLVVGPPRLSGPLTDASPTGFDADAFGPRACAVGPGVADGGRIEAANRSFEVLHLPGHSPGCIALYCARTKLLICGDVIYDGALVDDLHHSDKVLYRESLGRLIDLPVDLAIGGHGPPMAEARLRALIKAYLA